MKLYDRELFHSDLHKYAEHFHSDPEHLESRLANLDGRNKRPKISIFHMTRNRGKAEGSMSGEEKTRICNVK